MAMAFINGIADIFNSLITALDAIGDDDKQLTSFTFQDGMNKTINATQFSTKQLSKIRSFSTVR